MGYFNAYVMKKGYLDPVSSHVILKCEPCALQDNSCTVLPRKHAYILCLWTIFDCTQ